MSYRVLTALPVYNEEAHLIEVLGQVRQYSQDVLVVDDGSSDRTPLLLAEMDGIQVIRHEPNQGYGGALRTAFDYAIANDYDVLVTIDCDGQHQPKLIPEMAARIFPADREAPVDIVSGSRYLQEFAGDNAAPEDRRRINMEITKQLNRCFDLHLTDTFCGFKAYRVEALRKFEITELGYAMPLQLWIQAVRHGMVIEEFPVPRIYLDEARSFGGALDDSARRLAHYLEIIRREMALQHVDCGCPGSSL
ncbi:glycosyltransferase family 2 protein [Planctomyces sp. SH-PL14]|uniref:glycosyltransferase family 2 protein n=1 Tax=Planctomyces sp. SH-PL14 TaxID=1632864 RepID=UPI00078DB380|nr:glycosyltransferase family 2 protein [Planctomyces sp. SH-PL14]AMV22734.1 Undecaprenyl-phosphate mannosyltransferase [Planctomyces sp. SH-PL14]